MGGGSPVQLIVLTAPVLAFLLVYLSSKGDFMGTLRNKWWQLVLGAVAFGVVLWFWIQMIISVFQ